MISVRKPKIEIKRGDKFGNRTVIGEPFNIRIPSKKLRYGATLRMCVVQCECGDVSIVRTSRLTGGVSIEKCRGCYQITHGQANTKFYHAWAGMLQRCNNPKCNAYQHYGGRGIRVCEEWHSFEPFYRWSISNGFVEGLEIERIDNDGNYEPGNVKFVTRTHQMRNTRWNNFIEAFGERKCISEWASDPRCVVGRGTFDNRLRMGWSAEKALTTAKFAAYKKRSKKKTAMMANGCTDDGVPYTP